MDWNDIFANPDIVQWALTIGAGAVVVIAVGIFAAFGIKVGRNQLSAAARLAEDAIGYVNDPTDALIKWITQYWPTAAPVVLKFAPDFLRALADALEKAPSQEVNIADAPK